MWQVCRMLAVQWFSVFVLLHSLSAHAQRGLYCHHFVCLSVCLFALQATRQLMSDTNSFSGTGAREIKWLKRPRSRTRNRHGRGPRCVAQPINQRSACVLYAVLHAARTGKASVSKANIPMADVDQVRFSQWRDVCAVQNRSLPTDAASLCQVEKLAPSTTHIQTQPIIRSLRQRYNARVLRRGFSLQCFSFATAVACFTTLDVSRIPFHAQDIPVGFLFYTSINTYKHPFRCLAKLKVKSCFE